MNHSVNEYDFVFIIKDLLNTIQDMTSFLSFRASRPGYFNNDHNRSYLRFFFKHGEVSMGIMEKSSEATKKQDTILILAQWIKEYCDHLTDDAARKKHKIDSRYTRHLIHQWSESILSFMERPIKVLCPICGESIPLDLDSDLMTRMIISVLRETDKKRWQDIDFIKDKIYQIADCQHGRHKIYNRDRLMA